MMLKSEEAFRFVVGSVSYNTSEVFYAHLDPQISTTKELLKAIYYTLWFPGYFGFNWDALSDCLCDLAWIPCFKVVLVHISLPKIPDSELKVYLEILKDSVLNWKTDEKHSFEVVFQENEREKVSKLLSAL